MNICVFCSASDVDKAYIAAAEELGSLIAKERHTYVYGGAERGLMKVLADVVESNGGTIVGISFELIKHEVRKGSHELIIEKDLAARKATIIKRSDAFVVMPGGIGTLDEVAEILELKKHHIHNKPIAVLNTNGFYNGFKTQLERMEREGFLRGAIDELLTFPDTPQEAMEYIERNAKG